MIWGESGQEKTQPDQGNQTPTHNGLREGRGMLKGVGMNWRGELVVRVGWRLTDRGLVGRKEGREIIESRLLHRDGLMFQRFLQSKKFHLMR